MREVLELLFNLSIFATFHWGVCIPKEFAKSYVLICVYVCVCVRLFFFGIEGLVLHPFGANSKSLLLWEREGRG